MEKILYVACELRQTQGCFRPTREKTDYVFRQANSLTYKGKFKLPRP